MEVRKDEEIYLAMSFVIILCSFFPVHAMKAYRGVEG
jgi:hypothetical protein